MPGIIFHRPPTPVRIGFFVLLLAVLIVPATAYVPDTLTATFFSVGPADAILLQAPNGHTMLVDAGVPRAASTVSDGLADEGIARLDCVVLTHGDNDHIGGMVGVMSHATVGQFVFNGIPIENQQGTELQAYLSAHAIPTRTVGAGDTLELDPANVTVTVLNPTADDPRTNWNEASVVLRLVFGTQSFLLTGDAGVPAEERMLASGRPVASTVLKVGHHGISTSTGEKFAAAVHPSIAVISINAVNPELHRPAPEVVRRLQDNGATVYSTAKSGTVRVTATRTKCTVDTEDGGALPLAPPIPTPTATATPSPVQIPESVQAIGTVPPVTTQPLSVTPAVTAPAARPTTAFGKRRVVGTVGSFGGSRPGSGETSTTTGAARTAIAPAGTSASEIWAHRITPLMNR